MITIWDAILHQLENTFYGALVIMLSMLIGGELDRWYKIVDENSPFRNPFFAAYMLFIWFVGGPWIVWYFQIPRHGLLEPLFAINPYVGWAVQIGSAIIFIVLVLYMRRKASTS